MPLKASLPEPDWAGRQIEARISSLEGGLRRAIERVSVLGAGLEMFEEKLKSSQDAFQEGAWKENEWDKRFATIEDDLAMLPLEASKKDIELLKRHVSALYAKAQQGNADQDKAPSTSSNLLTLERAVLGEAWKRFRENREIVAALENATEVNGWPQIRGPLLLNLPASIPEDLTPALDSMLTPARDYHNMVAKLAVISRLVSGDLPSLPTEVEELMRIRELTTFLTIAQSSRHIADQLKFRLTSWMEDSFLDFADRFLQRFQQARLEGDSAPLEQGYQLILQILEAASLEPIELVLGRTLFDGRLHAEISPAYFPNLPDGVIVAVVRNGYSRVGQEVVRQAEVIVNRMNEPGEAS